MRRPALLLVLLVGAPLGACGRSDLGLETERAGPGTGSSSGSGGIGASCGTGGQPVDGGAAGEAGQRLDLTCPHLGGLQAHAPWPTARRCPGRTASTPAVGRQTTPTVVWSQKATGKWLEPAIAADGTVYAADDTAGVFAFTPAGSLKWAARLPAGASNATMLAIRSDGAIYALWGYEPTGVALYALSPDGAILWSTNALGGRPGGIEVAGDGTIETLGSDGLNGGLDSISPDGTSLSSSGSLGFAIVSPPALGPSGDLFALAGRTGDGKAVVVACMPGGSIDWSVAAAGLQVDTFGNGLGWPMVRDDGSIVFGDGAGLHALAADGSALWTVSNAGGTFAAAPDGTVYAPTASPNRLVAIRADGTIDWKWGTGVGTSVGRPIVDGRGTVYAAIPGGIVAIGSDGTQLCETSAAADPVAIDGAGTLYARDSSGSVLSALR